MRCFGLLAVLFSSAFCVSAVAADCSSYKGSQAPAGKDVSAVLDKTIAAVRAKNAKAFFALSDRKVLIVRRVVSDSSDHSGNIRLELRQRDFDAHMNIIMVNQGFPELAKANIFSTLATDNVISVKRDICEDARRCEDHLPGSEQIPFMLNDLMQCNQYANGIYEYGDGIYVTDMVAAPGKLPVGSALFFNKTSGGYRLAGVIIQN